MKKTTLILLALIYPMLIFAQGINFQSLKYDEAIAKAKAENKLIFLDCYTTWCGPCKMLANEVFPLKKAGDYFNPNFVSIKIDMEKGEGIELAKKLDVKAYPTLLVINGNGEIVVKLAGAYPIDDLISQIEVGKKNSYFMAKANYKNGKMTISEKINFINILSLASDRETAKEIANDLLKNATKEERLSKDFWTIYGDDKIAHLGNDHFNFILENKKELEKTVGKRDVDTKLYRNYFRGVITSIYGNIGGGGNVRSVEELETFKKTVEGLDIENSHIVIAQLNLAIARGKNDAKSMAENIEILSPVIEKGDIWGYASSFTKVFEAKPETKDLAVVKKVGKFFMENAEQEQKEMYRKMFKLE